MVMSDGSMSTWAAPNDGVGHVESVAAQPPDTLDRVTGFGNGNEGHHQGKVARIVRGGDAAVGVLDLKADGLRRGGDSQQPHGYEPSHVAPYSSGAMAKRSVAMPSENMPAPGYAGRGHGTQYKSRRVTQPDGLTTIRSHGCRSRRARHAVGSNRAPVKTAWNGEAR